MAFAYQAGRGPLEDDDDPSTVDALEANGQVTHGEPPASQGDNVNPDPHDDVAGAQPAEGPSPFDAQPDPYEKDLSDLDEKIKARMAPTPGNIVGSFFQNLSGKGDRTLDELMKYSDHLASRQSRFRSQNPNVRKVGNSLFAQTPYGWQEVGHDATRENVADIQGRYKLAAVQAAGLTANQVQALKNSGKLDQLQMTGDVARDALKVKQAIATLHEAGLNERNAANIEGRASEGALNRESREGIAGGKLSASTDKGTVSEMLAMARLLAGTDEGAYWARRARQMLDKMDAPGAASVPGPQFGDVAGGHSSSGASPSNLAAPGATKPQQAGKKVAYDKAGVAYTQDASGNWVDKDGNVYGAQ